MEEKVALLEKMKKELESKRKKLDKIQRAIKIKMHIKNKINENVIANSDFSGGNSSLSTSFIDINSLSPLSSLNKSFTTEHINDLESSKNQEENQTLSCITNEENHECKLVKQTNNGNICVKSNLILIDNAYLANKENINCGMIVYEEPINIFNDKLDNNDAINGTLYESAPQKSIQYNGFADTPSINGEIIDDDSILHFVDDIIALQDPDNQYTSNQNNSYNSFTKIEEEDYYRFELNERSKLITYIEIFKNLLVICFENMINLFSFENYDFKLENQWDCHQGFIDYVSVISNKEFFIVFKESNFKLIHIYDTILPFSIKAVACYKVWTPEISSIICNPADGLYFLAASSYTLSLNHLFPLNTTHKDIINECILHNASITSDIHTVISKLIFNEFGKVLITNWIVNFNNILSMSFIENEFLLCLFNQDGAILFWNYLTAASIYVINISCPITSLDNPSYFKEGIFFIAYSMESSKNILVINPSTNKYVSLFSNQYEKFYCWSVRENLKITSTLEEIIFNKFSCNENYFLIRKKSINLDENFMVKISLLLNEIFVVLFDKIQLNCILIK